MHPVTSAFKATASGEPPKELGYIPTLKLNDGNEIPMLGYGLGTKNSKKRSKNPSPLDQTIITHTLTALKSGYHHLDGAESYRNEAELGAAIAQSGLPRSQLFITTKTSCLPSDSSLEQALSRSLQNLNLDYVDLYLIHSPYYSGPHPDPADLVAKWSQMEAIKDSGRARSIGVSNFLVEHLEPILTSPGLKYVPAVNQIEYHPYLQHITTEEGDLLAYHRKHGIAVEAYAPLTAVTKATGGPVDAVYRELAGKYGVSEGEIALRWCLDQGVIAVTTSSSEERLRGWLRRVVGFKLTEGEVERISSEGRKRNFRGFWKDKIGGDDWR